MGKLVKDAVAGTPLYMYILIIFAIGMFIGAFFCPPLGQIDPTVYKSVSILYGGCIGLRLIDNLPIYIERGAKVNAKVTKKGIDVTVDGKDGEGA